MERVCPWYIFTTSNRAEGLRNLPPASVLASIYWVDLHQWPCLLDIFHAREFKKYTSSSGSVAEELRHDLFKNFPKLVKLFQDSHDRVEALDVAFRQLQSGLAWHPVNHMPEIRKYTQHLSIRYNTERWTHLQISSFPQKYRTVMKSAFDALVQNSCFSWIHCSIVCKCMTFIEKIELKSWKLSGFNRSTFRLRSACAPRYSWFR